MYAVSSRAKKVVVVEMWPLAEVGLSSEVYKLARHSFIRCPIADCVFLDRLGNKQSD